MLARSGTLPTRDRYAFELKWDGFRCLLSTENGLRARSRRGWDMTELLPELASFPVYGTFDGELVAFDSERVPDFPLICERMLMRRRHIPVVYVIFDVLSLSGQSHMGEPYQERRRQLEALNLNSVHWRTPKAFDDGDALFEAVCVRGLEGPPSRAAPDGTARSARQGSGRESPRGSRTLPRSPEPQF
jgi:bifunctional non-homologous end joining protein LigD